MKTSKSGYLIAMAATLLLAFALGASGLNVDPIWADELASLTIMGAFDPPYDLGQVLASLRQFSPDQAPLYYVLGAFWARMTGWSQVTLRALSLLSGLLMIAALYRLAADLVNRRTALVAALLMTTNAFVILYLHDIKAYALLMALSAAHIWLYWRLARGRRANSATWLWFTLSTAALLYTHNFAAMLLAALAVYHLLGVEKGRRWLKIALAWGVGALCFLPFAPEILDGLSLHQRITADVLAAHEVLLHSARLLVNGVGWLWLPLLASLGWALWRRRTRAILALLLMILVMAALTLIVNWRFGLITFTRLRYFLILWLAVAIVLAYGLTSLPYWRIAAGLTLLIYGAGGWHFYHSGEVVEYAGLMARDRQYPPMQDVVLHLSGQTWPGDYLIGFTSHDQLSRVSYNSSHSTSDFYLQMRLGIDGVFLHSHLKRYRLESDIRSILRAHPYILLSHDPGDVPPNLAKALEIIQEDYLPCAPLADEPHLRIQRYVQPVIGCEHQPTPINYDHGIRVIDRAARHHPGRQLIETLLWWDATHENLLYPYSVSLQLITADGRNLRQVDHHLHGQQLPWSVSQLSTAGLPPGDYRLMLILYQRDTGARAIAADPAKGESLNMLPLLNFTLASS